MRPLLLIAALLLVTVPAAAQPLPLPPPRPRSSSPAPTRGALRGHVDWQAHPAMDVPYRFFGRPFRELLPKRKLSSRHMLRQTVYAPYLRESGVRVFVAGAMAAEKAGSRRQAFRLIEEQLQVVADFVDGNGDDFALAKTPAEARRLLTTTDKIVVVHSIEGMHRVLDSRADAEHWARKGVMLATLVHLRDDEFGGSGLNRGVMFTNAIGIIYKVHDHGRYAQHLLASTWRLVLCVRF